MKKRIFTFLLAVILLIVMMPSTALAHKGTYTVHHHTNELNGISVTVDTRFGHGKIYSPAYQTPLYLTKNKTWTFTAIPDPGYECYSWWWCGPNKEVFTINGDTISIKFTEKGTKIWKEGDLGPYYVWDYQLYLATPYFRKIQYYNVTLNLGDGGIFPFTLTNEYKNTGKYPNRVIVPPYMLWPGYKLVGWDGELKYNSNKTLNAEYEYLVRFEENDNHMSITGDSTVWTNGHFATSPSISVDEGYRFGGWNKSQENITGPTVITANPCIKQARLTLKNTTGGSFADRECIEGMQDVGASVRLNDAQPITDSGWEFAGWIDDSNGQNIGKDPTVTIQDNCSYTAKFEHKGYTVSFKDQNGNIYSTPQTVAYGNDAVKPALEDTTDTRYDANNTAWEADLLNVTADIVITVALEYKVEFDPSGGTLISGDKTQWVAHGGDAVEPDVSPPAGQHWKTPRWNSAFINVTAPINTAAQYDDNIYTVSFVDQNGAPYSSPQSIIHGSDAIKPMLDDSTGTRYDTNDTAWEADLQNVTENMEITVALEYKVEFNPNGGTVESGDLEQWVAHGDHAAEPDITPPTGMHWGTPKWNNPLTGITTPVNTTAQYNINMYTVSFIDQNGDAYSRAQIIAHAGDAVKPVLDDPTCTRYDTNNAAWEADLLNVTEDREITVALEYLVTYNVSPGTSTDSNLSQWIQHGDTATAPTLTEPTGYDMDGWDSTHGPIDAPKTISANYVKEVYTVTIKDEAGNVLATEQVVYQDDVLTTPGSIALPSGVRFASTAWNAAKATDITGDTTIVAHTEYLVSFVVAPGTSSDPNVSQWVSYGGDAVIPLTTPPTGNHFSEPAWSSATTNITSSITVLASYDINEYTVSFVDYDGSAISAVTVNHGSAAAAPSNPSRTGWTFTGWDIVLDPITNNMTATARYTINTYTVTFVDYDGTVIDEQMVDWNTGATAPADPTRDGFTFTGWDTEFNATTKDLAVTALYEEVVVLEPEEVIPQMNVQDDAAVIEQEDMPQAKSATMFPWWWILIGVGSAALLFFLIFFWKRRKRDEQEA